jgi:Ca2+-binding RTX toxin-like protein
MTVPTLARSIVLTAGAALATLALPAVAGAAPTSLFVDSGQMYATAPSGDPVAHKLAIAYAGGSYTVTDPAGVSVGAGCTAGGATAATCPDAIVTGIAAGGGAAADQITIASIGPTAVAYSSSGTFSSVTGIYGYGGNDTIGGSPLADFIRGGDGNDTIDGGLGPDAIDGQNGVDTATYASRPASQAVFVKFQDNPDDPSAVFIPSGSNGGAEGDSLEVENVIGTPGNDTIIADRQQSVVVYPSSPANTFIGGAGNDVLSGMTGNDKLLGGPGTDKLLGGPGNDRCVGGPGKDHAKQCEHKKSI